MTERPLLFFPNKEEASRSKLNGGGGKYHLPSPGRQGERLSSQFRELYSTIEARRFQIQQSTNGIDPEEVLILETIGSVEDFSKAVALIEGFEWLGEIELEEVIPDEDFYDEDHQDKSLNGRLYLISTNASAMNQLLSLWNQFVQNPALKFPRGKSKFKDVFKLLKDIRKWDVGDRFEETKLLEIWKENLEFDPGRTVRFEIELWYRNNPTIRHENYLSVQSLVSEIGGSIITSCDISEIAYNAILAELPANEIRNIIDNGNTALIKCDNIMFFRPSGQIVMDNYPIDGDSSTLSETVNEEPPTGNSIIAIFDGFPLANHNILANRLIIDDPDGMESAYRVDDRKHGTAMCSLIVKGDLSSNQSFLPTPLYVRPIMRPNELHRDRSEFVPNDILLLDTINRAVKRMFEGENGENPAAPSVKIINLSIGDPDRVFYNSMSPLSKLLDWLSFKYKVLFIVSSGNNRNEILLNIPKTDFDQLPKKEQEKIFVKSILANSRNCRLIAPAESLNNLTVGAMHIDDSTINAGDRRFNPYTIIFPSTYTSIGGGYRRAIKPDFVFNGGRQLYEFDVIDQNILRPTYYKRAPGILVASPDSTLNKTTYELGTSISAALISRNGFFCYEALNELIDTNEIDDQFISVLIKAMLAHGCSWDTIGEAIEDRLDTGLDGKTIKKIKSKWIGYGYPDIRKSISCTEQRATVIGFGELKEEEAHVYNLPLPPSLAIQTVKRRLTITLAWFTPISANNQKYRTSRMWFESKNQIVTNRINSDDKAVRRGTLQHEIFEGSSAAAFIDGATISIKVNCSKDASIYSDQIPYAIIVSLEVAEGVDLPIYQEIKDRIAIPVPIGQRV
jgi:hypothetical protein